MGLRRVMGSSFGVGVRSRVTARWCLENGVRPVARGDVLNAVWPPTREDMRKVRVVLGKCRARLTNDEILLLRRRRDMITFTYDPLLSVCSVAIVFTRMAIGADNDSIHVLRSIDHSMCDDLTNPARRPLVQLNLGDVFDHNRRSYYFVAQEGDNVTATDTETGAEITTCRNNCSNIR